MKRVVIIFVVLCIAMSAILYLRIRAQRLAATRASGGSATIEGTEVDVVARIPGRIQEIRVEEGDTVKTGQPLVLLDCADGQAALAQAEAMVAAAETRLEGARVGLDVAREGVVTAQTQARGARAVADASKAQRRAAEVSLEAARRASGRITTVHEAGAVSDQALDKAQTEVGGLGEQVAALTASSAGAEAQAAVASTGARASSLQVRLAESRIAGAEQDLEATRAARDRAKVAVAECTLLAPRDGVVEIRAYEPGEAVLPGARLLTLIDTREVRATFYLPNAELGAASPGRAAEVVADAYRGRKFAATVRRVATSAEFTPRNVQTRDDRDRLVYAVEVAIPNPDGALRPGMPVEIVIPRTGRSK
jgi:HlyD family secretion protein